MRGDSDRVEQALRLARILLREVTGVCSGARHHGVQRHLAKARRAVTSRGLAPKRRGPSPGHRAADPKRCRSNA